LWSRSFAKLAFSRARKREELLQATEKNLAKIRDAANRTKAPLRGRAKIGLRAGRIINKHKMAKPFSANPVLMSLSVFFIPRSSG